MFDDETMLRATGASKPGLLGDLAAGLATAMLVIAPIPSAAQQQGEVEGASEGSQQPSDSESAAESEGTAAGDEQDQQGDEKKDEKGDAPTPNLYLLSAQSVHEDISSIVPERIGALLRDRIKGEGTVDLMPHLKAMKRAEADQPVSAAISKARKKYTSGLGLVNAEEYEEGAENLQSAVDTLKENIGELRQFDVLSDALKNLARAYWETGSNYDARQRMRQYAHLEPDAELDPKKFPEELRQIYERETKKVDKAGTGTLEISAGVEGAAVFVDGEKKGETPVSVSDVGFGHHYLVVRHPEAGTFSKHIRVRARGKTQSFDVELGGEGSSEGAGGGRSDEPSLPAYYTELQSSIRDGNFGADLDPYLTELRKETEADFIAWVVMLKNEESYVAAPFVYRTSDSTLLQGEQVEFNFELSNLMSGVDSLRQAILGAVGEMPEEKRVEKVSLVDEREKEGQKTAEEAGTQKGDESTEDGEKVASASDEAGEKGESAGSGGSEAKSVEPPPTPEEPPPEEKGGNKALIYGLVAGGTLLVGAGVVGGALYFGDDAGQQPNGFDATLTW